MTVSLYIRKQWRQGGKPLEAPTFLKATRTNYCQAYLSLQQMLRNSSILQISPSMNTSRQRLQLELHAMGLIFNNSQNRSAWVNLQSVASKMIDNFRDEQSTSLERKGLNDDFLLGKSRNPNFQNCGLNNRPALHYRRQSTTLPNPLQLWGHLPPLGKSTMRE